MEEITKFDLSTALEDSITCLQSGMGLEEVLKRYPGHGNELRPLVETAYWMRGAANQQQTITQAARAAQARSRMNFMRAVNAPAPQRSLFSFMHLRLATTLIIFAVLIFGLLGTHLAAVSALPGDPFFPVKLAIEQAQVNLATNPQQRIELIESYDQRRAEEVGRLKDLGRKADVDFTGTLEDHDGTWFVAGIRLVVSSVIEEQFLPLKNMDVEVQGLSNGETLELKEIHAHTFTIKGTIQKIQASSWMVDGLTIHIDDDTEINGQPVVGSLIDLSIHRLENGDLFATQVKVYGLPSAATRTQPAPTQSHVERTSEPAGEETEDPSEPPRPSRTQTSAAPSPTPKAGDEDGHKITSTPIPDPTRSEEHASTRAPTSTRTKTEHSDYKAATSTPSDSEHQATPTPTPER
jgi:hypothetical protein